MIAKQCDVCGRYYEPYGAVIEQEELIEEGTVNDETLEDEDADYVTGEEVPEINGMRPLTIDFYSEVQYNHDAIDMCPTCRDMVMGLVDAIKEHQNPTAITGVSFTFTTSSN